MFRFSIHVFPLPCIDVAYPVLFHCTISQEELQVFCGKKIGSDFCCCHYKFGFPVGIRRAFLVPNCHRRRPREGAYKIAVSPPPTPRGPLPEVMSLSQHQKEIETSPQDSPSKIPRADLFVFSRKMTLGEMNLISKASATGKLILLRKNSIQCVYCQVFRRKNPSALLLALV